jgi:hypothetical protein
MSSDDNSDKSDETDNAAKTGKAARADQAAQADDAAARKARADAIRHARDSRNASINAPAATSPSAAPGGTPTSETREAGEGHADAPSVPGADHPNYVDFIDRKMRERDKGKNS